MCVQIVRNKDDDDDKEALHQTDTACSWLVCHSRGDCSGEHCANCIHLPRPVFLGSQPCVPATWLAERLLLAGDIESNPGPKPTLKTLTHTQPPTITKYTNSSIQPPQTRPPPLSLVHPPPTSVQPPKTPTYTSSPPAPTLTPYTLDRIQHTRPDSPHISPPHKPPYVPTPAHSHTRNKQKTSKTKHRDNNSSTQRKRHKEHRGRT